MKIRRYISVFDKQSENEIAQLDLPVTVTEADLIRALNLTCSEEALDMGDYLLLEMDIYYFEILLGHPFDTRANEYFLSCSAVDENELLEAIRQLHEEK